MQHTALLVMDYQADILKMVGPKAESLLKNAKLLLEAARRTKTPVIYVQVAFRPGYPEVSPRNKSFSAIRTSERMILGRPGTDIHPDVAPLASEVVVVKHRVGAFSETEMATVLRGCGAEHLILAGISTSGVILSTVRYAADLDYGLTVVADACADGDDTVHQVLMEKVFPRQADVLSTADLLAKFKG